MALSIQNTDAASLYSDGNRPNSAGYDRVSEIWFAALKAPLGWERR